MQFEKSNDTKVLESVLKEVEVGATITYDDLSRSIGRDVREFAYPALLSARNNLEKELRIVFEVETNVGLVRLNDSGIVRSSENDRKKLLRRSKRCIRKQECVKFENLTQEEKRQHVTACAQFGAIAMFASKSASKKIGSVVTSKSNVIPIGETLKLFGGGLKEETPDDKKDAD